MTITAIVHIQGEEPVVGEIDDVPTPIDVSLKISNPRKLDGKDLHYLAENVVTVIWPISRLPDSRKPTRMTIYTTIVRMMIPSAAVRSRLNIVFPKNLMHYFRP